MARCGYRRSAGTAHAAPPVKFGYMYGNGVGFPQDYIQAHMWFSLAAAKGDEVGRENRDRAAKKMSPADISKAQVLAREWLEKHGE